MEREAPGNYPMNEFERATSDLEWIYVVWHADKGDCRRLINRLRSTEFTRPAALYLADFLERHQFKIKRVGGRPTNVARAAYRRWEEDLPAIIAALKSRTATPRQTVLIIADALEKYRPEKKRGGQKVPIYFETDVDVKLRDAYEEFRVQIRFNKKSRAEALTIASDKYSVGRDALADFIDVRSSKRRRE